MATAVTTPPKTVILAVPVVPDPPVSATLAYVPDIPPEPGVMAPSFPIMPLTPVVAWKQASAFGICPACASASDVPKMARKIIATMNFK